MSFRQRKEHQRANMRHSPPDKGGQGGVFLPHSHSKRTPKSQPLWPTERNKKRKHPAGNWHRWWAFRITSAIHLRIQHHRLWHPKITCSTSKPCTLLCVRRWRTQLYFKNAQDRCNPHRLYTPSHVRCPNHASTQHTPSTAYTNNYHRRDLYVRQTHSLPQWHHK